MRNVLRVLARDLLRILKAPASIVVVLALIVLPSLYTWFNVVGFWDPYGNTSNLRVCVVNLDEGATSDLTGEVNLGDMVEEQLHDNTQLGWDFVDHDTAMEAVKSGQAYAAFVVPQDFSADLLTLISGDFQQPELEYYVNEKMNPVSPKITDTGANTLESTINATFVKTVTSTVVDTLEDKIDEAQGKIDSAHLDALSGVDKANDAIGEARSSIAGLEQMAKDSQGKIGTAKSSLETAKEGLSDLNDQLRIVQSLMGATQSDASSLISQLSGSLDSASLYASQSAAKVNSSVSQASAGVTEASGRVAGAIAQGDALIDANEAVSDDLRGIAASLGEGSAVADQLVAVAAQLDEANETARSSFDELGAINGDLGQVAESIAKATDSANTAVQTTINNADAYRSSLSSDTLPTINSSVNSLSDSVTSLAAATSSQSVLIDQTAAVLDQLSGTLGSTADALSATDGVLGDLQADIQTVETDLLSLKTSLTATDLLGDGGTINSDSVADFMQSPTEVVTEYLYPLNSYGTGMAPLFINMSLWIGVFMLMVIMRIECDDEGIENMRAWQRYAARYLFFGVMVVCQAIVCCVGCLYIGVQCVSVPGFILTACIASLVYLAIQLTLSTTLQHIGKGLCVIMIFVQIPGATGLYPVEMTSSFFQMTYPLFPFTYGINALRETIGGFYGNDWLVYLGKLSIFFWIFVLIGIFVRPYCANLIRLFSKEIEKSDIINGEQAQLPERRFRSTQLLWILSDRDEFRQSMAQGAARFLRWYPRLIRGAIVVGIAVPAIVAIVFAVSEMEKVVALTLWLVWMITVMAFLVVVEYVRDNINRKVALNNMSDDEVRTLFGQPAFAMAGAAAASPGASEAKLQSEASQPSSSSSADAPEAVVPQGQSAPRHAKKAPAHAKASGAHAKAEGACSGSDAGSLPSTADEGGGQE